MSDIGDAFRTPYLRTIAVFIALTKCRSRLLDFC